MKIEKIDFDQPTVVVLGAGATRGAEFVGKRSSTLHPLDSDFFMQAQRLSNKKPEQLVKNLITNTVNLFGKNFSLTMEGFLTRLEHLSNVFEDYKHVGRPSDNPCPDMRTQFLQVLAAVLDEAIGREPKCQFHKRLVECLKPKDTILSFDYDWLIDYTLKTQRNKKWNPRKAYGVRIYTQQQKRKDIQKIVL